MKKRNTPGKQRVRQILEEADTALSQDRIEARLKGELDRVTIYRILASFEEDGVVHRVMSDEGKAFYALCKNCGSGHHEHEHAHFRCMACQKVECLPTPVKVALPKGYSMQHSNYFLSGLCQACK